MGRGAASVLGHVRRRHGDLDRRAPRMGVHGARRERGGLAALAYRVLVERRRGAAARAHRPAAPRTKAPCGGSGWRRHRELRPARGLPVRLFHPRPEHHARPAGRIAAAPERPDLPVRPHRRALPGRVFRAADGVGPDVSPAGGRRDGRRDPAHRDQRGHRQRRLSHRHALRLRLDRAVPGLRVGRRRGAPVSRGGRGRKRGVRRSASRSWQSRRSCSSRSPGISRCHSGRAIRKASRSGGC